MQNAILEEGMVCVQKRPFCPESWFLQNSSEENLMCKWGI